LLKEELDQVNKSWAVSLMTERRRTADGREPTVVAAVAKSLRWNPGRPPHQFHTHRLPDSGITPTAAAGTKPRAS